MQQGRVSLDDPAYTLVAPVASEVSGFPGSWAEGSVTFCPATQAGVEVEFPMYTNNLFVLHNVVDLNVYSGDYMENYWFRNFVYEVEIATASAVVGSLVVERAAAEDFCFMRFQGGVPFSTTVVA
jgi:hypothetical protein